MQKAVLAGVAWNDTYQSCLCPQLLQKLLVKLHIHVVWGFRIQPS